MSTTTDGTVGLQPQVTLSYTYDALDRRTAMSDSLGGTTSYAYDPEDRLTGLTAPWGTVYNFGYDGEGRRTSLTSTSGRVSQYGYSAKKISESREVPQMLYLSTITPASHDEAIITIRKRRNNINAPWYIEAHAWVPEMPLTN